MANNRELLKRLSLTKALPSLPQVVSLTLSKAREKESSAEDVAEIIAEDPSMTAHVLRVANNVLYNPTVKKITSVKQALARIGFNEIQKVVVAIGIIDLFPKTRLPFDYRRYWRHCIATAQYSELIARHVMGSTPDFPDPDTCFVGGLLHEIGMLPIAEHLGARYGRLFGAFPGQRKSLDAFERDRIGVAHTDVGAELIARWKLGEDIAVGARFHHDPHRAPESHATFARIVHVADWLSDSREFNISLDAPLAPTQEDAWCKLTLSTEDAKGLHRVFDESTEDSTLFYLFD